MNLKYVFYALIGFCLSMSLLTCIIDKMPRNTCDSMMTKEQHEMKMKIIAMNHQAKLLFPNCEFFQNYYITTHIKVLEQKLRSEGKL